MREGGGWNVKERKTQTLPLDGEVAGTGGVGHLRADGVTASAEAEASGVACTAFPTEPQTWAKGFGLAATGKSRFRVWLHARKQREGVAAVDGDVEEAVEDDGVVIVTLAHGCVDARGGSCGGGI